MGREQVVIHEFVFGSGILVEPDANKLVAVPYFVAQLFAELGVNHVDAFYNLSGEVVVGARITPVVFQRENNEFV